MTRKIIPTFFIVGAPKAGTTSLYSLLNAHPEIFMSPEKEPNFFSNEEIGRQGLYYKKKEFPTLEEYQNLFSGVGIEKAVGESSVSYLYYPTVAEKIYRFNPRARIIIMLRDPVARAFSHYLMDLRLGHVVHSFEDVVFERTGHKHGRLFYQQFIELGLYASQVERYLNQFGEDSVKILIFEEFKHDVVRALQEVFGFLEVRKDIVPPDAERKNVFKGPRNRLVAGLYKRERMRAALGKLLPGVGKKILEGLLFDTKKPVIDPDTRNHLETIYGDDILRLGDLLDRDLTKLWKSRRLQRG